VLKKNGLVKLCNEEVEHIPKLFLNPLSPEAATLTIVAQPAAELKGI
jgi:hypothetical protein